jgi:phosphate transport system substrate-binding protein
MRQGNKVASWALAALVTAAGPIMAQAAKVDAGIPGYQKTSGVSGNVNSIGSDTLNNLMTLWAEGFQKQYPNVRIQIEGKGSTTAPPALISGTSQLGPMSREMKASEIDEFEKKYGYKPTAIRVAVDALAVYVNKDNPLAKLTLQEVDAIFSKGRTCGAKAAITTWGQTGLKDGAWGSKPISLYGRNSASGTYGFFKEHVLQTGDYKDEVKEQPGSASVVQGVTEDRFGIGYSGIGYKTSGVKALKLAQKEGGEFFDGAYSNVTSGKYPLSRFLYIYINKAPGKPLDPLVKEYIKLILSKEGQEVVVKDGYLPLAESIVAEELKKLE